MRSGAVIVAAIVVAVAAAGHAEAQTEEHVLVTHGVERTYLLTVPPGGGAARGGLPLVIMLHGANQSAGVAVSMTGFDHLAMDEGFFAAFPDGTNNINRMLTWDAIHCCGYAATNGVNDLGFISDLVDELIRTYPIDPNRVYVVGFSNGGMLAQLIGITMPDRIAAIGAVMGGLFGDETSPRMPVPAILINGGRDHIVPMAGGAINGNERIPIMWDGMPLMPFTYQVQFWTLAAGCDETPTKHAENSDYLFERYDCPGGTRIESYVVLDNGHAWPGDQSFMTVGEVPSTTFDATRVIWDFLSQQNLADRPVPLPAPVAVEVLPPPAPATSPPEEPSAPGTPPVSPLP